MNSRHFDLRLVWHVVGHDEYCREVAGGCTSAPEPHVLGAWNHEGGARAQALAIDGHYVLACPRICSHYTPWQRLAAPDGRTLRLVNGDIDFTANDYAAWWARVNVPIWPGGKREAA